MTNYAILLGFGLFDPSNSKYKAYLDRFTRLVQKKKIDVAVLCGGHTNLKFPDKSEAGTIAEYLKKILPANVRIELEEKSLTSEQNIQFAKQHIDFSPQNKIFLVSDSVRFFKYYWMALYHWFGLSREEVYAEWFKIAKKIYENPKRKSINIELKDLKKFLQYKNVQIIIDSKEHKDFNSAVQVIVSEVVEIDGLYSKTANDLYLEQTKAKEEARAKFGLQ